MINQNLPPTPGPMPSLMSGASNGAQGTPGAAATAPQTLQDLMADAFYLLLLVKRGRLPADAESFVATVQKYLDGMAF